MNTVTEVAIIGFGLVGAVVAGNAAAKIVARNGGTECEKLAAGCVAAGLSAAVLPAAAVAGLACTVQKGVEFYQNSGSMKLAVAEAKAKTLGTMDKLANGRKPVRVAAKRA
jgi:hypothetical protein